MSLCKRLIARLDVKGTKLIKGIRFEGLKVVGDSCDAAINYYNKGVDEILYIDSVASLYGRNSLTEILKKTSKSIFIPITAGGGIRSISDGAKLLAAGADKIAINTALIKNPKLIKELAKEFGSQCVVVSIQARNSFSNQEWECLTEGGREKSNLAVIDWIKKVQDLGAGEILLTSVDNDGTCKGPDHKLIEAASQVAKIPLIVGGGISKVDEIKNCFKRKNITGVSLAAALHYSKIAVSDVKNSLINADFTVRSTVKKSGNSNTDKLGSLRVGIIDYGMGNQQSLINAFTELGIDTVLTSSKKELLNTNLIALPGVGSFPNGMNKLQKLGLAELLKERAKKGHPIIGICLGMQMLFDYGSEFQLTKGLSLIEGKVEKLNLDSSCDEVNILPHVGWNKIYSNRENSKNPIDQYFVHSYAAVDVPEKYVSYKCQYSGNQFVAAVNKDCISGFQFHPERSGLAGLKLLTEEISKLIN